MDKEKSNDRSQLIQRYWKNGNEKQCVLCQ